jgi:hypothetical protein
MTQAMEQRLRVIAGDRCEYCRMPQSASRLPHVLDHIIARQHGGKTEFDNLALCCGRCNQFKGPNIAGIDPQTSQLIRLFDPRSDSWTDHFRYESGALVGQTPIGRATIAVLSINSPLRIAGRRVLIGKGIVF